MLSNHRDADSLSVIGRRAWRTSFRCELLQPLFHFEPAIASARYIFLRAGLPRQE
jgi:hypothetical protein